MGVDGSERSSKPWLHRNNGWIVTPVKLLWSLLEFHCLWHSPRSTSTDGNNRRKNQQVCRRLHGLSDESTESKRVHPSSYPIQGGRGLDDIPAVIGWGWIFGLWEKARSPGPSCCEAAVLTTVPPTERAHVSQHYDKCPRWWIIGLAVMCTASMKVMRAVFENGH